MVEKKRDLKADICNEVHSGLVPSEEIIDGVGEVAHVDGPKPRCCLLLHLVGPKIVDRVRSRACKV